MNLVNIGRKVSNQAWIVVILQFASVALAEDSNWIHENETLQARNGSIEISRSTSNYSKEWKLQNLWSHPEETLVVTIENIHLKHRTPNGREHLLGSLSIADFPVTLQKNETRLLLTPVSNDTCIQNLHTSPRVNETIYWTTTSDYISVKFSTIERNVEWWPFPTFKLNYVYMLKNVVPTSYTTALTEQSVNTTYDSNYSVVNCTRQTTPAIKVPNRTHFTIQFIMAIVVAVFEAILLLIAAIYIIQLRRYRTEKSDNSCPTSTTFSSGTPRIYENPSELRRSEGNIQTISNEAKVVHNELYNM